jgi:hypothetical protein
LIAISRKALICLRDQGDGSVISGLHGVFMADHRVIIATRGGRVLGFTTKRMAPEAARAT